MQGVIGGKKGKRISTFAFLIIPTCLLFLFNEILAGASTEEFVCVLKFIIPLVLKLDGAYKFD